MPSQLLQLSYIWASFRNDRYCYYHEHTEELNWTEMTLVQNHSGGDQVAVSSRS